MGDEFLKPEKGSSSSSSTSSPLFLSKTQKALSAQARYVVYAGQHISYATFSDPFFKEMLRTVGDGPDAAILTEKMLKMYIMSEFSIFLFFLRIICKLKMEQSLSTPSAQIIHDGGTAANKRKYQVFGMQIVDPRWLCNLVVCIGFISVLNSKDVTVASLIELTVLERTGFVFKTLFGLAVSDRAALGVANILEIEEDEACMMHDGDKVGAAATGKLTRSRHGTVVNPFESGRELMVRAHKMAAFFSWGSRQNALSDIAKGSLISPSPNTKLQLDLNTTRVASEHGLLHSILRMSRSLKVYHVTNPGLLVIKDGDWVSWAEFEAVLFITQTITKLAQFEKLYMAAFAPIIKAAVYSKLCAPTIKVIDLDAVTDDPILPRIERAVTDMTETGKMCRLRAIIEFERRFMGSTSQERLHDPDTYQFEINGRVLVATLLDLRTLHRCHHLTVPQRAAAKTELQTRYITFYVTAKALERKNAGTKMANDANGHVATSPEKKSKVNSFVPILDGICYGAASHDAREGFFSDDEDDDEEDVPPAKTEETHVAEDKVAASNEFKKVFRTWYNFQVDWAAEFPEANLTGKVELDLIHDLMPLNMGKLYLKIITKDPERAQFGFLPLMAGCCDGQIGALNAESFAERVLSASNLVMTDGNTQLCDRDFEMLVVLRMNRDFMLHMRSNYFKEIKAIQPFNVTVPVEMD
jgi:hypothetical protein